MPSDYGVRSKRAKLRERWARGDGPQVAERCEAERCYTRVRIGPAEFAFTRYEPYVAALQQAWRAGFVPEPGGSARGAELADAAPNLRGVDSDLCDLLQLRRRAAP